MKRTDIKLVTCTVFRYNDRFKEEVVSKITKEIKIDTFLHQQYYDLVEYALNEYENDNPKHTHSKMMYTVHIVYCGGKSESGGYTIIWTQDELLEFKKIEDVNLKFKYPLSKLLFRPLYKSPDVKLFDLLSGRNCSHQ